MSTKKHLVVIGHPDNKSFCYNGIFKTIVRQLKRHNETFEVIDVYDDKLHRDRTELIKGYKETIKNKTEKTIPKDFDEGNSVAIWLFILDIYKEILFIFLMLD